MLNQHNASNFLQIVEKLLLNMINQRELLFIDHKIKIKKKCIEHHYILQLASCTYAIFIMNRTLL